MDFLSEAPPLPGASPLVYLAGPMTGRRHYNVAAFEYAAAQLRDAGYEVLTPFDSSDIVFQRHYGRNFDPLTDRCDYGDPLLADMVSENMDALCRAGRIAVLAGWEESKGSRAEVHVAQLLGFPALLAATLAPVPAVVDAVVTPTGETILQEAQRLVHGDRGAAYGHPLDDYSCTGRLFAAVLEKWLRSTGLEVDVPNVPAEICTLLMIEVKVSRQLNRPKRDNMTDAAGYAECTDMILAERRRREAAAV